MSWIEVEQAEKEHRFELILNGDKLKKYLDRDQSFDENIWKLEHLNFLELSDSHLIDSIPDDIQRLKHLTRLTLSGHRLTKLENQFHSMENLRHLNLSNNCLKDLGEHLFLHLNSLETLNLSINQLDRIVLSSLENKLKLSSLNLSNNKLHSIDDLPEHLPSLSFIDLSSNRFKTFPKSLLLLNSLKILHLQSNELEIIPNQLSRLNKLKDLRLKFNPIKDNRLKKLIEQEKIKQILEYFHRLSIEEENHSNSTTNNKIQLDFSSKHEDLIEIIHFNDETIQSIQVVFSDDVQQVRPFLICYLIDNLDLSKEGNFKRFLRLQNEIHDELCQKRTLASLGTHDLNSIASNVIYDAQSPDQIHFHPIGKASKDQTAKDFYLQLCREAEQERKIRKRNHLSGLYKYLTLMENQSKYAFLQNQDGFVLSISPLANSEESKLNPWSSKIFVEISSTESIDLCRRISQFFIEEIFRLKLTKIDQSKSKEEEKQKLILKQVRLIDRNGKFKLVYPSRTDLQFDQRSSIRVERILS